MSKTYRMNFDNVNIADVLIAMASLPFSDIESDDDEEFIESGIHASEDVMGDASFAASEPMPTRFIPGKTSVLFFDDGTKSIVTCAEDTPYSEYNAFCAAYAKRKFGSNNQLKKLIASIRTEQKNKSKKKKSEPNKEDAA